MVHIRHQTLCSDEAGGPRWAGEAQSEQRLEGQVATGGVNGESFGDDLLKKFFMCLILAVLGLCGVWAFFIFRERGLLPSGAWGLTAVASLVAGHRL